MPYIEFTPGEKYSTTGADIMDNPDYFKDAGYLIQGDEVIVDIDDPAISHDMHRKMIEILELDTEVVFTDRGIHLYFKFRGRLPKKNGMCPMGFEVELKNHSNVAVTVKRNGKIRERINPGKRAPLPAYLKPSSKRSYDYLVGLGDGDQRNNKLFALSGIIGTAPDKNRVLRFVNDVLFAEPLNDKEFEIATRDGAGGGDEPEEYRMTSELIDLYKVCKYAREIFFKHEGKFSNRIEILERLVYDYIGAVNTRFHDEIMRQFKKRAPFIDDEEVKFPVKFKNGLVKDGEFLEVEYDDFTPYTIPHEYKPDAPPVQIVDEFLEHMTSGEPEYRDLVFEIMGHCLITDPAMQSHLAILPIITGAGKNGKGTFFKVLKKIFSMGNMASLSLQQMNKEQYVYSLKGKLVNLADDIENKAINNEQIKMLKNVTSSDIIEIRALFEQSEQVVLTTTIICTSNHPVKTFDKDYSVKRRIRWLPMYARPKVVDPLFFSKLTTPEAMDYWIKLMMDGYFRLYENQDFTKSQLVDQCTVTWQKENDPSIEWLQGTDESDLIGKTPPEVYAEFKVWYEENVDAENEPSKNMLRDNIRDMYALEVGPKKIGGRTHRVYLKADD